MRTLVIKGKTIQLMNQQEKAQEIGINVRNLRHRIANGKMIDKMIQIPGSTKAWYLPESQDI